MSAAGNSGRVASAAGWRRLIGVGMRLGLLLLSGCTGVFLQPDRHLYFADRPLGTPAVSVEIPSADGIRLHALFLPATTSPRGLVLFLHGNAENLSSHVFAVNWLPAAGYGVLVPDYRGYGRSEGRADLDGAHADADAALRWLLAHEPQLPVVVYGQSLGASVAIRLVAAADDRARLRALVADSGFASYRGIAREKLAQAWLTWPFQWLAAPLISDRHAAVDVVAQVAPVPLLLIHGERDRVVPIAHAETLYAAARPPRQLWRIAEGGHIDGLRRPPLRKRLTSYLDEMTARPVDPVP